MISSCWRRCALSDKESAPTGVWYPLVFDIPQEHRARAADFTVQGTLRALFSRWKDLIQSCIHCVYCRSSVYVLDGIELKICSVFGCFAEETSCQEMGEQLTV